MALWAAAGQIALARPSARSAADESLIRTNGCRHVACPARGGAGRVLLAGHDAAVLAFDVALRIVRAKDGAVLTEIDLAVRRVATRGTRPRTGFEVAFRGSGTRDAAARAAVALALRSPRTRNVESCVGTAVALRTVDAVQGAGRFAAISDAVSAHFTGTTGFDTCAVPGARRSCGVRRAVVIAAAGHDNERQQQAPRARGSVESRHFGGLLAHTIISESKPRVTFRLVLLTEARDPAASAESLLRALRTSIPRGRAAW